MRTPECGLGLFVLILLLPSAATHEPRKRTSAWPLKPAVAAHGPEASGVAPRLVERALGTAAKPTAAAIHEKLPLGFEENRGQTDKRVKYLVRGRGYLFFLTPSETVLSVRRRKEPPGLLRSRESSDLDRRGTAPASWSQRVLSFAMKGANPHPRIEARHRLPGISNYFIGSDPSKWRMHIPNYEKVIYHAIYPGIDAAYYGKEGRLESDFLLSPGSDPSVIRMKVTGAQRMETNAARDLVLSLGGGEIKLAKPVLYQEAKGERKEVAGGYRLLGGNQVGFTVGPYDRRRLLVIDPTLVYSTYLGGSGTSTAGDQANAIAVDSAGETYVTGSTTSTDFPTASPFQAALGGTGVTNVLVTKFSATGNVLIFSTYLGGSGTDMGNGIALDSSGDAYVTGSTNSSNFPHTDSSRLTGLQNAFITKLSPSGSALVFSTYLGGNNIDVANAIAVDGSGNAFVTGNTNSMNFPVTLGVVQPTLAGSLGNAFVANYTPAGARTWATYLGGSGGDEAFGIAVDSSGNVHVTGLTSSTDFPVMSAFQPNLAGIGNAFVSELNSTGTGLMFSTYLGGSLNDQGGGIAVDSSGNSIVAGVAGSPDFPLLASLQGHDPVVDDLFVAKFASSGNLVFSTLFGDSSGNTDANAVALDSSGNIYVTGHTGALFLPTLDPLQGSTQGSNQVAFVVELKSDGSDYLFSTFLGGTTNALSPTAPPIDSGQGIAVDTSGNIYVAGLSGTSDFPTVSPVQPSLRSTTSNGFVSKISPVTPTGPQVFPSSLNLGTSSVGSASVPQLVTVANGTSSLTISQITITGANAADFRETDSCGLALPPGVVCTVAVTVTPSATGTRTATLQISDSDPSSPQTVSLTAAGVTPPATGITVSPLSLTFPSTEVGVTGTAMAVTVTNTGSIPVSITTSTSGANPADFFSIPSSACPSPFTLAPGASCGLNVFFAPTATGSRAASLQISGNFKGSPTSVSLSGMGTPPIASLTPLSLSFGNQVVSTTSPARVITLTNTSRTLTLSNIMISSGDPEFGFTTSCGTTLGSGMSCTISVTFTPSGTGPRSATIGVTDTDPALQSVSLTGNGVNAAATLATIFTTSLPFARQNIGTTSAPLSVSLQNLGNTALAFTAMLSGTNLGDFGESDSCRGTIPPGGFCNSMVTFTPTAIGVRSAVLTYNSTTPGVTGVPQSVMLTGTGVAATTAVLDPISLAFPAQPVGVASPPQIATFANTGNRPLFISTSSITGPNAADFSFSFPSSIAMVACGGLVSVGLVPVNPQVACSISFVFRPSAIGLRTATFTIMDSSSNSPHMLTLNGQGIPAPAVSLSPTSMNFGTVPVGVTSSPMIGTLLNSGTAVLSISSITITGPNAGDFAIASGTTCVAGGTVGFTPPSNTCQFNVTFKPSTATAESATLTFTDDATPTTQTVSLSAGPPAVTLSPTSVTFPGQTVGTASAPVTVTLTNTGEAALSLSSVALSGPNAADFAIASGTTCTTGLTIAFTAPSNTCVVNLTFTPSTETTESAMLTFADNASPTTQTVSLSGTGTVLAGFTLAATGTGNPTLATINPGDTAQFTVVLTPNSGFTGTVNFSCSNLPPHGLCQIPPNALGTPASVAITGPGPVTLRVNVQTNSLGAWTVPRRDPGLPAPLVPAPMMLLWGAALLMLLWLLLVRSVEAEGSGARWAIGLALVLLVGAWAGCGGGAAPPLSHNQAFTPPGTYVVSLAATTCSSGTACPGGVTQSLNLTVRVDPILPAPATEFLMQALDRVGGAQRQRC